MTKVDIERMPVGQAIETMKELTQDHWKEVPFGNYQLELDLDTDTYVAMESGGHCTCLIASIEGVNVGYLLLLAGVMLHHKGLYQVTSDSFYVAPEYRAQGVFPALLAKAEELCAAEGLPFLSMGLNPQFKENAELEQYIKSVGYSLTELTYTKKIEE